MITLDHDFETSSRADLKKVGLDVYARHPSTKVLMMNYSIDMGDGLSPSPVRTWLPHKEPMPRKIVEMLEDPKVRKVAHNAAFERAITEHVLMIDSPIENWVCTMVMALSLGLPGKLETLVRDALKLDRKYWKDAEGDRLMRMFSFPNYKATWESHPQEFLRYIDYGKQDVVAEAKVYNVLKKYINDPVTLFRQWAIDQRINQRGIPVDLDFIDAANDVAKIAKARYKEEMREFSGIDNPNAPQQALPWLAERGYPFASLAKNRVQIATRDFKDDITPEAHEFIGMRLESNKTSLAKFEAIKRASARGRLRGVFQFRGAGATGRYAGRVLGQNIPRPAGFVEDHLLEARELIAARDLDTIDWRFGRPLEVLSSSIRSAIAAPKGKKLVVADLASIETCVIAWWTNCRFWLDTIESGLDAYKAFGSRWLEKPYEEITKFERGLSKPPTLGCGFRMGPGREVGEYPDVEKTGLWGYAANMGVQMTKEECKTAVKVYRELSPEIVQAWYDLDRASMECVETGEPRRVGILFLDYKKPFLRLRLPSGRYLHYCRPRIEQVTMEYENADGELIRETKMGLTYERLSQSGKWVRRDQHGGRFAEQATQAIAYDLLQSGIENCEAAGLPVVMHWHDEIGCEVDEHDDEALDTLIECMTALPKWADGLPLRAEGYEAKFYRK